VVELVHPKAMSVLLKTPEAWRTWLETPVEEALQLQRPLPDEAMREVARGKRSDGS
jgi:putative SOS response-associated peptidase YedK